MTLSNKKSIKVFDLHINAFSLKFYDDSTENEFWTYYSKIHLTQLRWMLILSILYLSGGYIAEYFLLDISYYIIPRAIFVNTIFMCCFIYSFTHPSGYMKHYRVLNILLVIISSFNFIIPALYTPSPLSFIHFSGLFISQIFNYTAIRQDFIKAGISGLFILMVSILQVIIFKTTLNIIFYLIIINCLGMYIAYSIEHDSKKNFIMLKKIKANKTIIEDLTQRLKEKKE